MLDCHTADSVLWLRHFLVPKSVVCIIWVHLGDKAVIGDQLLPQQEIIPHFIFTPYLRDFNSVGRTMFSLCLAASSLASRAQL